MLRWGLLAGFVITIFVVRAAAADTRDGNGRELLRLGVLALLSLAEWSLVVGWVIGAAIWTLGHGAENGGRDRKDHHANGPSA